MDKVIVYFYEYDNWNKQFTVKALECEEKEKTYKNTTERLFSNLFIKKTELDMIDGYHMYSLKNDLDSFKERIISKLAHQIDLNEIDIQGLNKEIIRLQQDIEIIKNSMNNKE